MKYQILGKTGLMVSEHSIGGMNFGGRTSEEEAREIVKRAYEVGINTFDTSDSYPNRDAGAGVSESILGRALKPFRHDVLISTKVGGRIGKGPNSEGLSRHRIIRTVEESLRRLQTDYIDLLLAHVLDPRTPIDETLRAFSDLVASGKVRYIGCSNYDAWQVCKALWISDKYNLARFEFVQARLNLITRMTETEMLPLCAHEHLGVFVFNPLAGGLLAGGLFDREGRLISSYGKDATPPKDSRFAARADYKARYWHDRNLEGVGKLQKLANEYGYTPVQLALAWILANKTVTSVLTCPDFVSQLDQNVSAVEITLSEKQVAECNEVYEAMLPAGWSLQDGADIRLQWL